MGHAISLDHFSAVLFDMDGVITDSMPYHCEAWKTIFSDLGISITTEDVLAREGEKGFVTLRAVLNQHRLSLPDHELNALLQQKESIFRRLATPRLFEGAKECVEDLSGHGKRLALVTGTSSDEVKANLPASVLSLFHVIISADKVTRGKPDPEPYLLALRELAVSPGEALVIENAPYGIRSAKAAGIFCIALTTSLPSPFLREADMILKDLHELREALSARQ